MAVAGRPAGGIDGILVTRPQDSAADTARRLSALGWRPVVAPMLRVVPRDARLPAPASVQALLVTSATTLAHLPDGFQNTPLLAVGDATADRAWRAGYVHVESASADAAALARLAAARCNPAGLPLLLPGAVGQGDLLADNLTERGFRVLRHAVYGSEPVAELPEVAKQELKGGGLAAAMFFSPATARSFVTAFVQACPANLVLSMVAIAISDEAAAPLTPLPWRVIRVAKRPNQDELLALLP